MMLDLTPATEIVTRVVADIDDDQLGAPTPSRGTTVADLLDHLDGLCRAFTAAAAKDLAAGGQAPSADGSRLGPDWRTRIPGRLARLASAWQDKTAWAGLTRAGGVDLPGDVAAHVAINEVVVHGWDLAAATTPARPSWSRRPARSFSPRSRRTRTGAKGCSARR
jgi:uncharacterized protein (TIGR03086 family)